MKKLLPVILFLLLIDCSFGQDMVTLVKLHDFAVSLGSTNNSYYDTLLMKARAGKMDIRITEQLINLLRAAESYSAGDYQNSIYYVRKVPLNYKYPDYYNLKMLLFIGTFANLKDLENTARYFYIVNKVGFIDPYNMTTMRSLIRNNFTKDEFDDALSHYYYYHQRSKLLAEIGFVE